MIHAKFYLFILLVLGAHGKVLSHIYEEFTTTVFSTKTEINSSLIAQETPDPQDRYNYIVRNKVNKNINCVSCGQENLKHPNHPANGGHGKKYEPKITITNNKEGAKGINKDKNGTDKNGETDKKTKGDKESESSKSHISLGNVLKSGKELKKYKYYVISLILVNFLLFNML